MMHRTAIPIFLSLLLLIFAVLFVGCGGNGGSGGNPTASTELVNTFTIDSNWVEYVYKSSPVGNPLMGFVPYVFQVHNDYKFNALPYSMEFVYIPLKDLMTGPNSYTFETGLEPILDEVAERGNQLCFRVFLDYPGGFNGDETGVPQFLLDSGLAMTPYPQFGGGLSPDYSNEYLISILEDFISELGKRYDGDPRIGFITAGLLGFAGEWQTYPTDHLFATHEVQNRILNAYDHAFKNTKILVRYPTNGDSPSMNIGFHDDSFAYYTLPTVEWHFWSLIMSEGIEDVWKREPIGGELRPEIQVTVFDEPPDESSEDITECIEITHCSWMLAWNVFTDESFTGAKYNRLYEASRRMGYELHIKRGKLDITQDTISLNLEIENTGIAPFYYDWGFEVAVINIEGNFVKTWKTNWQLSTILPETHVSHFIMTEEDHGLSPGTYIMIVRVRNPMVGGKNLKFANETQDYSMDGWTTLGKFSL